jgi:hypothetical protein
MIFDESSATADAQHVVDCDVGLADRASHLHPLRPLDFDRRDSKKQRARKIALAADAGLRDRFFGRHIGELFGKAGRRRWLDRHEIDCPGHGRLQAVDRKTCDGPDAGFACGEFRPVIGLAGAERCHNTHAGDDNDRPAEFIA